MICLCDIVAEQCIFLVPVVVPWLYCFLFLYLCLCPFFEPPMELIQLSKYQFRNIYISRLHALIVHISLVFLAKMDATWQQFHGWIGSHVDILRVSRFTKTTHVLYLYCTPSLVRSMLFVNNLSEMSLRANTISNHTMLYVFIIYILLLHTSLKDCFLYISFLLDNIFYILNIHIKHTYMCL